jgi:transposase
MSPRPKQLSLNDIFTDCLESFTNDKPKFFALLDENLDIDSLIPITFRHHFYQHEGRPREYPLTAFIRALILQRIFSIPTDSLLLVFLQYSREFREFCGFLKVPDASKITRFKQDFVDDLQVMFDRLVELTEPVCQAIDAARASMTIFDTSGIEAYVQENNLKYADSIIKRLKAWKKAVGAPETTTRIKPLTHQCRLTHFQILKSSRCISTDISAMHTNSALLPTGLAPYGTLPSMMRITSLPTGD